MGDTKSTTGWSGRKHDPKDVKNVQMAVKDGVLWFAVDLNQTAGLSGTGKSLVVGTTGEGLADTPAEGVRASVRVYKPLDRDVVRKIQQEAVKAALAKGLLTVAATTPASDDGEPATPETAPASAAPPVAPPKGKPTIRLPARK